MRARSVSFFGLLVPIAVVACTDPNQVKEYVPPIRDAATADAAASDTLPSVDAASSAIDGMSPATWLDAPPSDVTTSDAIVTTDSPSGCPATELRSCEGRCVDLTSDPLHCGACGNACGAFQTCNAGRCAPGFTAAAMTGTLPGTLKDVALAADGA